MRDKNTKASTYHMNYFRNSNAMDVIIDATADESYLFTYKAIGGIIDFRILLENSISPLIQKFHTFLGASTVPPFWSLGFHQSKWGYVDIDMFEKVI